MKVAKCGRGIFVTGAAGCNEHAREFKRRIHIWHGPGRGPAGEGCRIQQQNAVPAGDLSISYTDGESLKAAIPLDDIAAYARLSGDILVHCAAGQVRGPTVALLAMTARGEVPWHAIHGITAALWLQRRVTPRFYDVPLREIFEWWERNRWG